MHVCFCYASLAALFSIEVDGDDFSWQKGDDFERQRTLGILPTNTDSEKVIGALCDDVSRCEGVFFF